MVKQIDSIGIKEKEATTNAKVMLLTIDGWGINNSFYANAIAMAKTPYFDSLWQKHFATLLLSGKDKDTAYQSIFGGVMLPTKIEAIVSAINENKFSNNSKLVELFNHLKKEKRALHLLGFFSSDNVFDLEIASAFLQAAKANNFNAVYFHLILQNGGANLIGKLSDQIATLAGNFYNTDQKKQKLVIEAMTKNKGQLASSVRESLIASKEEGFEEEFLVPLVFGETNSHFKPLAKIEVKDAILLFNFEHQEIAELVKLLTKKIEVSLFDNWIEWFLGEAKNNLVETLDSYNKTHLIAEEKNWREEIKKEPDFLNIRINAIAKIALETGDVIKTKQTIEKIDKELKEIISAGQKNNYEILISGSFGLAEELNCENDYSLNPVPLIFLPSQAKIIKNLIKDDGSIYHRFGMSPHSLADIAPTILALLNIAKPATMLGKNFLEE